jgi:hypothetical protein
MEGFYNKFAEICIDSRNNVIINYPIGVSYDRMFQVLDKAIVSLVKCREN